MTTEGINPTSIPIDEPLAVRIGLAVERYGEKGVAELASGLLQGRHEGEDILLYLGGRHALGVLGGAPALYWPEVWGARALSYVWDETAGENSAASAVLGGLHNRAWRVREMCAKVCIVRQLGGPENLSALLTDEVARVRAAGARALAEVGRAEHAEQLKALLRDPDKDVRRRAQEAIARLAELVDSAERLDSPLE
ncbi:MAG: HEAT repeat domain-containing protein [Lacisediminihabitans sp.]